MNSAPAPLNIETMPVLAKHLGVWEGTYSYFDMDGNLLDRHKSRLEIGIDGNAWVQRNIYTWDDGRQEIKEFPGQLEPGFLSYDNEKFWGIARESGDRTIILTFKYKDKPDWWLNEIITLVTDTYRGRTWQYFQNDVFVKLCVIAEHKVA
ncbi:MAG: DUF3598 family protein [Blastocatellia bacterium]|nr:DUF3598 family protein [Blastocatellia bacterium]